MGKTDGEIASQKYDAAGFIEALRQRHETAGIQTIFQALYILQILFKRFSYMSGHADVPAAGLHGVQRGGEGEREFVEMVLEITVAGKTESTDDSNNGRGIRLETFGHGAHAEQDVLARVLQDRTDDFLPLDTELVNALGQMGGYFLAIHVARGLPNLVRVSTQSTSDLIAKHAERPQALLFRCGRFGFQAGGNHRLKERHHRPKFRAELFDRKRLLAMPSSEEARAAFFVFFDPGLREAAVADFGENLAHFLAGLFGD